VGFFSSSKGEITQAKMRWRWATIPFLLPPNQLSDLEEKFECDAVRRQS
jgi:hypothetical protein